MSIERQSLKQALASIEKDLGTSVQMLGDMAPLNVEAIHSGSFLLDAAIGVGGYPRGRIIEVFGAPSGGKCIEENSLVFCEDGLVAIKNFGSPLPKKFVKLQKKVKDVDGVSETSYLYNNGVSPTVRLTTSQGFSIEGTTNHPVVILNGEGNLQFKELAAITKGDILCIQRNQQCWGSATDLSGFTFAKHKNAGQFIDYKVPTRLTKSLARLLGYLVAEGYTVDRNIRFTNADPEVVVDFQKCSLESFGVVFKKVSPDGIDYVLSSAKIWAFLQYCGLISGISSAKEIPRKILAAPKDVVTEYMRAYFEGDGGVEIRYRNKNLFSGKVCATTASPRMASQLQTLFLNYGIIAGSYPSMKAASNGSKKKRRYWTISLSGNNVFLFKKSISFISKNKIRKLAIIGRESTKTNVDSIPHLAAVLQELNAELSYAVGVPLAGGNFSGKGRSYIFPSGERMTRRLARVIKEDQRITYTQLDELVSSSKKIVPASKNLEKLAQLRTANFFYDKIASVSPSHAQTYDFEVPGSHSFIANGVINHNTTMSLLAIAQAQKMGGRAAFIDVEHAFSVEYAQSLGIDTDKLYFVQPDFGEEALTVLERLTATNEFDIIVLDSTAALLPKAEMEEEIGKQFMALQARMMSQALRKLTPIVGKTKTVVIFINQTRQNVGVMYGNPTTTPGGEALKFYSSVRLNVRRLGGSDVKDGKDILGHIINITCVKNKVAPPLKSAEITFIYGKGIDTVKDMIEYALNMNVLAHEGNTYTLGDLEWVGREKTVKAISEDPALAEKVKEMLLAIKK